MAHHDVVVDPAVRPGQHGQARADVTRRDARPRQRRTGRFAVAVALVVAAGGCGAVGSSADSSPEPPFPVAASKPSPKPPLAGDEDGAGVASDADGTGDESAADDPPSTTARTPDSPSAPGASDAAVPVVGPVDLGALPGVDVSVVPEELTVEYVQSVLATMAASQVGPLRRLLEHPTVDSLDDLPDELVTDALATVDGPRARARRALLEDVATDPDGARAGLPPADGYTGTSIEVVGLLRAQPSCVIAAGRVDTSGAVVDGGPVAALRLWSMARADEATGLTEANPTPWVVIDELALLDETGPLPADELVASSLAELLDRVGERLTTDCRVTDV